eukprot:scaffold33222_cov129-Isochrysis_galbana.AAC.6
MGGRPNGRTQAQQGVGGVARLRRGAAREHAIAVATGGDSVMTPASRDESERRAVRWSMALWCHQLAKLAKGNAINYK